MPKDLEALLKEERIFKPSKDIVEKSNIQHWMNKHEIRNYDELLEKANDNPDWFWDELAKELEWFEPYNNVLEWNPPHAEWFLDGKFNIVHNALDKHIKNGKGDKLAYIWEGEDGKTKKISYRQLWQEVNKFANALRKLGVKKGDTVSIYLPMIP
ncbi:MAG TPA: acetyl-coenzyme A synthetase N-terminal domain-containing protein, partial [Methanobacterium sp.]|nr:acetyl-coenzyme A synthetase N-terminal domain-containing protein [Methanobacterium sp.]